MQDHAVSQYYAVLVRISPGYPPLTGRLHTCYSPVRRSPPKYCYLYAAPRLACVRPVASVHPEPGSNSSLYLFIFLLSNVTIFLFIVVCFVNRLVLLAWRLFHFLLLLISIDKDFSNFPFSYTTLSCSLHHFKELVGSSAFFVFPWPNLTVHCAIFLKTIFLKQKDCKGNAFFLTRKITAKKNKSPAFSICTPLGLSLKAGAKVETFFDTAK